MQFRTSSVFVKSWLVLCECALAGCQERSDRSAQQVASAGARTVARDASAVAGMTASSEPAADGGSAQAGRAAEAGGSGRGVADRSAGTNAPVGGNAAASAGGWGDAAGGAGAPDAAANGGTRAPDAAADGGKGGTPALAPPGVTKDRETLLTDRGLDIVSYGGYLNGESFQQEGVLSFLGYQYAAYWNTARHVTIARRRLPDAAWSALEFTDYTNQADDAHNTISIGISAGDGVLHLAFDHHSSDLHYRRSMPAMVTQPDTAAWTPASFTAVTSALVNSAVVAQVTYPRFISEPGGDKLLLEARIGESGSGDEYLWEYTASDHAWTALGKYIDGISASTNAYLHGIAYTPGGSRLHVSWCWRETADAATNHDLVYVYSDDHGRTWRNDAGSAVATTGRQAITQSTAGITAWTIAQHRGLLNQEHMIVDSAGRVHVLLSHMSDTAAADSDFTSARSKSQYFHYGRDASGHWTRTAIGLQSVANFRGKLAISAHDNLYAVLPDLRIAGASSADDFAHWTTLTSADAGRFFSDPLIDAAGVPSAGTLTIVYPLKASSKIYALDYVLQ